MSDRGNSKAVVVLQPCIQLQNSVWCCTKEADAFPSRPASVGSYVIIYCLRCSCCANKLSPRERRDDMLPADGDPKIAADLRPSADGSAVRTSLVADGG